MANKLLKKVKGLAKKSSKVVKSIKGKATKSAKVSKGKAGYRRVSARSKLKRAFEKKALYFIRIGNLGRARKMLNKKRTF